MSSTEATAKKIIAINGSPRSEWNTAQLLQKALEGARAFGAETKLINLYELDYRGCVSCFACKRKDREHGVCAMRDDLTAVLDEIKTADGLILGSPIYLWNVTSGMFAFLERFVFSNMIYSGTVPTVFPKPLPSAFLFTMNVTESQMEEFGMKPVLESYAEFLERVLTIPPIMMYACNTYQFTNYELYESSIFSEPNKKAHRETQWPIDCQQAFSIGASVAKHH